MTAKELMQNVEKAQEELRLLVERRNYYLEMATSTAAFGGNEIHGTNVSSRVEDAAVSIADLAASGDEKIREYTAIVQQAESLINKIPQYKFRQVLTYKYLLCLPWATVSEKMGYSDSKSVYRARGYALQALQKVIDLPQGLN
jgi:hypothetical protein